MSDDDAILYSSVSWILVTSTASHLTKKELDTTSLYRPVHQSNSLICVSKCIRQMFFNQTFALNNLKLGDHLNQIYSILSPIYDFLQYSVSSSCRFHSLLNTSLFHIFPICPLYCNSHPISSDYLLEIIRLLPAATKFTISRTLYC